MKWYIATVMGGLAGVGAGEGLLFIGACLVGGYVLDLCHSRFVVPVYSGAIRASEFFFLLTVLHARVAKLDGQVDSSEVRMFREVVLDIRRTDRAAIGAIFDHYRKQNVDHLDVARRLKKRVGRGGIQIDLLVLLHGLYAVASASTQISTAQQTALRGIANVWDFH